MKFIKIFLQLLQYLGHTSPECLESFDRKLNEPTPPPISADFEQEAIGSVISERNMELDQSRMMQHLDGMLARPASRPHSRASKAEGFNFKTNSIQQGKKNVQ